MYCLYPAKMWANQDSRLSWCQTFLLRSDDHHAVPGRLATCGAIIPAMQHRDVQGGECSAVMNRPQEPTEVNTSFLRGDFVIFVGFCFSSAYIYIYHLYPEAMEALHLQNDFKKALGGFLTVFLTAFGESAPFDSDVCAWLQVQKSRFAGTRKIFSRQATSTRTYQNCIPTIPRDVQENWGDFPTTFWVPWNRKIHELCWRWPPSKHAWPNVMRPSSEVAGPHGCANDWRWFSMTYHQNGWFQWKNCGVFWMQNLQTMDGFNWWITETLGATWFVMHHGGSAMDFALQATLQTGAEVGDLQRLRDFAEELWRWDRSDRSLKPTERCFIFKYLVGNLLKPFNTSSILY